MPFRHAAGGGREIHFSEERDIDLSELISSPLPKVPLDIAIRGDVTFAVRGYLSEPRNASPMATDIDVVAVGVWVGDGVVIRFSVYRY